MYFISGSLNLEFENPRITATQAVVQKDLPKISVHAKNHDTIYGIVNLEDTTNITLLGVVTHNANPFIPTFHIMVWWLKEERVVIIKLFLLVDKVGWFVLSIIVIILLSIDWNSTNSHKGELVIAYNNKAGNKTLHPREVYALYKTKW